MFYRYDAYLKNCQNMTSINSFVSSVISAGHWGTDENFKKISIIGIIGIEIISIICIHSNLVQALGSE